MGRSRERGVVEAGLVSVGCFAVGFLAAALLGCSGAKNVKYREPRTGCMPELTITGTSPGTVTVTAKGANGTVTGEPSGGGQGGSGTAGYVSYANVTVTEATTGIEVTVSKTNGT